MTLKISSLSKALAPLLLSAALGACGPLTTGSRDASLAVASNITPQEMVATQPLTAQPAIDPATGAPIAGAAPQSLGAQVPTQTQPWQQPAAVPGTYPSAGQLASAPAGGSGGSRGSAGSAGSGFDSMFGSLGSLFRPFGSLFGSAPSMSMNQIPGVSQIEEQYDLGRFQSPQPMASQMVQQPGASPEAFGYGSQYGTPGYQQPQGGSGLGSLFGNLFGGGQSYNQYSQQGYGQQQAGYSGSPAQLSYVSMQNLGGAGLLYAGESAHAIQPIPLRNVSVSNEYVSPEALLATITAAPPAPVQAPVAVRAPAPAPTPAPVQAATPAPVRVASTAPSVPQASHNYGARAEDCLAEAMYHEARGTGSRGMRAVGEVVLNRAHSSLFPSTVCAVVDQRVREDKCQFSYRCDGRPEHYNEPRAKAEAYQIARTLLAERGDDITDGAMYFHADRISPEWFQTLERQGNYGGHIFYR